MPNQVYAKLIAVQFLRDGEAFGAGPTSAEGFGEEEVSQRSTPTPCSDPQNSHQPTPCFCRGFFLKEMGHVQGSDRLHRIADSWITSLTAADESLSKMLFEECGPTQEKSVGWCRHAVKKRRADRVWWVSNGSLAT